MPALPLEMDGKRFGVHHDIPDIGEDGQSILQELGYNTDDVEHMKSNGIIEIS